MQKPKGLKEAAHTSRVLKAQRGYKGLKGNSAQADASSQTKGKKGYNALKA